MKKILIISTIAVLLSSCATSFRTRTSDTLEINKGQIQQVSKIAEYQVGTAKVKGTYTGSYKSGRSIYYIELAKEIAIGNAISDGKCDFLVHPLFDISVIGTQVTVNVEGYPASYTSFKTWTRMDSIPAGYVKVVTKNKSTPSLPDKKGGSGKVVRTIILVSALTAVLILISSI